MSDHINKILDYHKTRNFGSNQNAKMQAENVRSAYKEFSVEDQAELAEIALDRIRDGDKYGSELLRCLACFQPGSLRTVHERMIDARVLYPGFMFYEADSETAIRIIQALDQNKERIDKLARNHLLSALAWIGDASVQAAFFRWRTETPSWASSLHVPPHAYAREAGWELTDLGQRRNLFSEVAHPLVRPTLGPATRNDVEVGVPSNMRCPWCNALLVELLSFKNLGRVFAGQAALEFRALTRTVCTAFGQVFAKQEANGSWRWHDANIRPKYLPPDSNGWDAFPKSSLAMSNDTRNFMEAVNWLLPGVAFSQVGGHPTWVQYAEYRQCPDCSKTMIFVGQISNEDYDELSEGIYYVFACLACRVSATLYQQS